MFEQIMRPLGAATRSSRLVERGRRVFAGVESDLDRGMARALHDRPRVWCVTPDMAPAAPGQRRASPDGLWRRESATALTGGIPRCSVAVRTGLTGEPRSPTGVSEATD